MANNQNFKVKNGLNVADEATIVGNLTARGLLYPTADGTDKQVLTTDGSGAITLQTPSTTNVTEVPSQDPAKKLFQAVTEEPPQATTEEPPQDPVITRPNVDEILQNKSAQ